MAKEKEKEQEEEKQVPEKPKKKSGGSGDVNYIQLIGIIGGAVVAMAVILIVAFKFFILPDLKPGTAPDKKSEASQSAENEKKIESHASMGGKGYDMTKSLFSQTGRITTNPKGSEQFVVVDLGLMFANQEESSSGGEHEGAAKDPLPDKIKSMVRGSVNNVLGSMTVDELQQKRDSLNIFFYDKLKGIFYSNKLTLNEVIIQEYIIQQ